MDYQRYFKSYNEKSVLIYALMVILFMLLSINVALTIALISKNETVVLLPPHVDSKLAIAIDKSNEGYKKSWALYLSQLLGNVTPKNLSFIKESVAPILDPQIYNDFMLAIDTQAEKIKQDRVTMHFEPSKVTFNNSSQIIYVFGKSIVKGPYGDMRIYQRTYEFKISIDNYRPVLLWMDNYISNSKSRQ
ncbi:MAG: TraE/TraK family type IV conjugative transfer system protein [Succinivibrionaceae bacterium]